MNLKDFDFRIFNLTKNRYEEHLALVKLDRVLVCKTYNINAKPYLKYDEIGDEWEIELFTGFKDKNNKNIYEGDIIAHLNEFEGVEYYSKVIFSQEKRHFIFECIELPVLVPFCKMANQVIKIVGNIHENKEFLGEK